MQRAETLLSSFAPQKNGIFIIWSDLMFCSQSDDEHGGPGLQHGQACVELLLVPW